MREKEEEKACTIISLYIVFFLYTRAIFAFGFATSISERTVALADLFKANGLAKQPWQNYRLVGTQIAYTDNRGTETRLGNTKLEGTDTSDSSCISCHAGAAWGPDGNESSREVLRVGTPVSSSWFTPIKGIPFQTSFIWSFVTVPIQ